MAKYLLIESRDPFESNDVGYYYELATGLAKDGNDVTLFLVQNGVFTARKSPKAQALKDVAAAGVTVKADDFSLRERGIESGHIVEGVETSPLDFVVDQMADGAKTIWH
jgi:predicted peroxiredoxin